MKALPSLEVRRARRAAIEFLRCHRITRASDLSIEAIACLVGLEVERGPLSGALARLTRVGEFGTIRVSDRIIQPGAQRFSVAHELGHFVLEHPTVDAVALCDSPRMHADSGTEAEATGFAVELLMPESVLRRRCEISPIDLALARAIADEFLVSLMAASIRFVELTSERCAVVFARDGAVLWVRRSPTFAPFLAGTRLDERTVAFDAFTRGRVYEGCQPVPADAWIDREGLRDAGVEIWEEAVIVPESRGVMSLLWIPESVAGWFDRE